MGLQIFPHETKMAGLFHPNMHHSVSVGRVLPLIEAALCCSGNPSTGLRTEGCCPRTPPTSGLAKSFTEGGLGSKTQWSSQAELYQWQHTNINSASRHTVWPCPTGYPRLCLNSLDWFRIKQGLALKRAVWCHDTLCTPFTDLFGHCRNYFHLHILDHQIVSILCPEIWLNSYYILF